VRLSCMRVSVVWFGAWRTRSVRSATSLWRLPQATAACSRKELLGDHDNL
jgi:hypothetical protein